MPKPKLCGTLEGRPIQGLHPSGAPPCTFIPLERTEQPFSAPSLCPPGIQWPPDLQAMAVCVCLPFTCSLVKMALNWGSNDRSLMFYMRQSGLRCAGSRAGIRPTARRWRREKRRRNWSRGLGRPLQPQFPPWLLSSRISLPVGSCCWWQPGRLHWLRGARVRPGPVLVEGVVPTGAWCGEERRNASSCLGLGLPSSPPSSFLQKQKHALLKMGTEEATPPPAFSLQTAL